MTPTRAILTQASIHVGTLLVLFIAAGLEAAQWWAFGREVRK